MSFHRQRKPRKRRTQQMDFPCEEAPGAICRERINDSSPVRRIAGLSKSKRQTQIICRAGLIEINECWKVSLLGAATYDAPTREKFKRDLTTVATSGRTRGSGTRTI